MKKYENCGCTLSVEKDGSQPAVPSYALLSPLSGSDVNL